MRVWRLSKPIDTRFASASRLGTWEPKANTSVCPEGTATRQKRVSPLIIEWDPGSDIIGDFVWPGFDDELVVTEQVFKSLSSCFRGFKQRTVAMYQNPKLNRPKRVNKRTRPRVWLPYQGPVLHDLWVASWAHVDLTSSSVRQIKKCSQCGYEAFEVDGIEKRSSRWDKARRESIKIHQRRMPGKGLFIAEGDLEGADLFRVHEFPGWILCTDRLRKFICHQGFSNIEFLDVGDVVT